MLPVSAALDADTSNEWANMTPSVRGNRDVYVLAEYLTPLAGLVDRLAWNAVTASRSKVTLMLVSVTWSTSSLMILSELPYKEACVEKRHMPG